MQAFDEARVESAGFDLYAPQTRGVNNGLSLRFTNPLLSDIRVRQALVAGVDAQEVVDTIFTENYPVATSALSSSAVGYKDESEFYAYDPEKSAELLDEAGWDVGADGIREKDGERLSLDRVRGEAAAAVEADARARRPAAQGDRRRAEREVGGWRHLRRGHQGSAEDPAVPLDGRTRGPRRHQEPVLHEEPQHAALGRRRARRACS